LHLETIQDYGQNILENINSSIIIVDLKGKILYFNKSAYWLFKKKRKEEIIGNFYFNILVGSEKLGLKNIIKEVIKTEKTFLEYEIDYPEFNKQIIINMRVSILKDINKQKVGLVIIIEDITSDKKTGEEKIKEKKLAAFGELANSLAHEIINPLAAIKALVQLLPEKLDDKKFTSRFVKEVTNEVERIDKIFKNLFYVTRSPRNSFKNINLNKIVSEVLFSLEGLAEKKNIQIDRKLKTNLPQIVADTNQLKQVFLNIILNAFQAMPEGGFLKVFTNYDHKNDLVKIMFVDNGYGINKKLLDKVFDPFFSTKEDGTGIGLSVSYNIVQQHGGFIQLTSTEGKGSTFTVVLPCSSGVNCFEKQNIIN
jgi:PAS domain S-box-containing protein